MEISLYFKRLLSCLDRNPMSNTFGCFQRDYWHYKTVTDFPCPTYQQGTLSLAVLYNNEFLSEYFKNKKILDFINAGLTFWSKTQNRDGSFNEWFPNEHSHVATAFTSYAISETLLTTEDVGEGIKTECVQSLERACDWLLRNPDTEVINHTAGAVTTFYNVYLLTGNEKYKIFAKQNLDIVIKNQNDEGWYSEYGGADLGYLSVSVFYLAQYYLKSKDEKALNSIKKALEFASHFIHPDGTIGGEYGSRNTKYFFVSALYMLSDTLDVANLFIAKLDFKKVVNLDSSDDRYFIFFFLPDFLLSLIHKSKVKEKEINPYCLPETFNKFYSDSGLVSVKTKSYHFVCNLKKNGVFKYFSNSNKKIIVSDSGYFFKLEDGIVVSSQRYLNEKVDNFKPGSEPFSFESFGELTVFNQSLPLTKYLVPFRIFNYTFGHFLALMNIFNRFLKKSMIVKSKGANITLKRKFTLSDEGLKVYDKLSKNTTSRVDKIVIMASSTTSHIPSSRYFMPDEIVNYEDTVLNIDKVAQLNKTGSLELSSTYS